ncbi:aminotransferase class III-fold pyridoxal phosphate-dependent enzyme [Rhodococcus sp. WS4]|nr:aminotransferase class III-fold pyridoxal phosphate-dependent enzyme [Rhodococcus sp. WS4]
MTVTAAQDHRDTHELRASAGAHLWRHFADMTTAADRPLNVMVRGEGCYLIDSEGNRYLDGLSNLFCVNLGYSYGEELGQAALDQYRLLGYHSSWGSTHPTAIELATVLADLAPANLNHVFLTPSGGESVEAAWKLAREYHSLRGEKRWKAIGRNLAYHGTTLGALSLNGLPELRSQFEPLVPGAAHVRNTKRLGRPASESEADFTGFLLDDLEERILAEDPATIAMVIMEPVQNHGGALMPPAGYFAGVRALCDKYGILLVSDETITAFGRCGSWFASERFGMQPDIITTAKGLSSAYAVIGALIATEEVFSAFHQSGRKFTHGNTFGGHPVMAAVALRNIELMKELDLPGSVRNKESELRNKLEALSALPAVVDVRGTGFFYAIELATTEQDGERFSDEKMRRLYGDDRLTDQLAQHGVLLRLSMDGGDPVLCIAPPLVADTDEIDHLVETLHQVLTPLV